jgi:hypothetical protein
MSRTLVSFTSSVVQQQVATQTESWSTISKPELGDIQVKTLKNFFSLSHFVFICHILDLSP